MLFLTDKLVKHKQHSFAELAEEHMALLQFITTPALNQQLIYLQA
jgi:hypothetical protein